MKTLTALASLLAATLLAAGCGGSGSTSSTSTGGEATAPAASTPTTAKDAKPGAGKPSGSGSSNPSGSGGSSPGAGAKAFETHGGDNSIQGYGSESGGSELQQAATALHGYLDARAAGEWGKACSYMVAGVSKSLQQFAGSAKQGKGKSIGCPKLLAALSAGLPPSALREAAIADVGALRVQGGRAFLLFHGAHHADYFMPMAKEGGEWKVAALAASALP